jgi:hypothetical protein
MSELSRLKKEVETLTWMRDGVEAEFNAALRLLQRVERVPTTNKYGSIETVCLFCDELEGREHGVNCEFKKIMARRPDGPENLPMPAYQSLAK